MWPLPTELLLRLPVWGPPGWALTTIWDSPDKNLLANASDLDTHFFHDTPHTSFKIFRR